MSLHIVHSGRFGAEVVAVCLGEGDALSSSVPGEKIVDSDTLWIVMGQADLGFLQATYQARKDRPLVCAFLCARYLAITPLFGRGSPCPICFQRRFLSMPPPGLSNEATFALTARAGVDSGFDSWAFPPILPAMARLWLRRQSMQNSRNAVLVDQAGLRHSYSGLTAVHGCQCRGYLVDGRRTTAFYEELFT